MMMYMQEEAAEKAKHGLKNSLQKCIIEYFKV